MQEAATVAASATRWWKRAGDTMKESETAKKEELEHKRNAETAELEAERAEQQAKQLEAIGHFEVILSCTLREHCGFSLPTQVVPHASTWCPHSACAHAHVHTGSQVRKHARRAVHFRETYFLHSSLVKPACAGQNVFVLSWDFSTISSSARTLLREKF